MSGNVDAATPTHGRPAKAADTGSERTHGVGFPARGPMRALMRRSDGDAGALLCRPLRAYRRCPCGQLFPVFAGPGRPPVVCGFHRRPDGHYGILRRRLARKKAG